MMPQFTYDTNGNAVGVFLPIEDWNRIQDKLPLENTIPQWQMDILDHRMTLLVENPNSVVPFEDFIAKMEKEANDTPAKNRVVENVKAGLEEVRLYKKGKLKTTSAKDFLNKL